MTNQRGAPGLHSDRIPSRNARDRRVDTVDAGQPRPRGPVARALARAMLALIRAYQQGISPGLGTMCRFEPTCSRYAYEAIEVHGPARGLWLAVRRLGRCHPGTPGGYDPVPEARRRR